MKKEIITPEELRKISDDNKLSVAKILDMCLYRANRGWYHYQLDCPAYRQNVKLMEEIEAMGFKVGKRSDDEGNYTFTINW